MGSSECRAWYEGDPVLEAYHDREWCRESHDDRFLFEMLCLEGASVGLSWRTIMHKREAYRAAFHGFDIAACARMSDAELEALLHNPGIIRNRAKVFSVRKNAQAVQALQAEFGSFDAYVWSFTGGERIDGRWRHAADIPTESVASRAMSADMKKRGIAFVGPVITYSFLQAVGVVNDHLADCPHR
ncbi:MAG: DNA-3-methyladenine glycosylase I [Coriobacteriaceae bacterium]|nr:DNA-3-methyladenine glycosylase I [Coriobacteriaceae bacterium]